MKIPVHVESFIRKFQTRYPRFPENIILAGHKPHLNYKRLFAPRIPSPSWNLDEHGSFHCHLARRKTPYLYQEFDNLVISFDNQGQVGLRPLSFEEIVTLGIELGLYTK